LPGKGIIYRLILQGFWPFLVILGDFRTLVALWSRFLMSFALK